MSEATKALIICGGISLLVAGFALLVRYASRKRASALESAGKAMGLSFSRRAGRGLLSKHGDFHLCNRCHGGRKLLNHLSGDLEGTRVDVFDYHYIVGADENGLGGSSGAAGAISTVATFQSDALDLPYFCIVPKGGRNNARHAMAVFPELDVETPTAFARHYRVGGAVAERVTSVLFPELTSYLASQENLWLEGCGNTLVFLRFDEVVDPPDRELRPFLEQGVKILNMFLERAEVAAEQDCQPSA